MAKVDLQIAGNSYSVACRDGEEVSLLAAAALVDAKAQQARQGLGGMSEIRQLLFASLLLADELADQRRSGGGSAAPAPALDSGADADLLEEIADRLEKLAARLEQRG